MCVSVCVSLQNTWIPAGNVRYGFDSLVCRGVGKLQVRFKFCTVLTLDNLN